MFLPPEYHNMSNKGIHFDKDFMDYAHKVGEKDWIEHYNKTEEDFIREYGKSYL